MITGYYTSAYQFQAPHLSISMVACFIWNRLPGGAPAVDNSKPISIPATFGLCSASYLHVESFLKDASFARTKNYSRERFFIKIS
jgi:hypothetical protein